MSFKVTTKLVTLPSDTQLYTERITANDPPAEGTTSTIVLVHGVNLSTNTWYPIYGALTSAFPNSTLLAYDWSGLGNSPIHPPRSQSRLTFAQLIEDLDALIAQEVPKGPISIVAHSAGALLTSQLLLSSSPAVPRVTHAVFIGGPLNTPLPEARISMQMNAADHLEREGVPSIIDTGLPFTTGVTTVETRPVAAALVRAISMMQSWDGAAAALRAFSNFCKSTRVDMENFPMTIKFSIIAGEEDLWFTRETMSTVLGRIPGHSKFTVLPKVGQ